GCKITKAFNRKPPNFWDVMVQCFVLHDVQSQSQHSAGQRRRELINECEDDLHGSDTDSGDMPETQVHETQEEEDIYRVIIDDYTPCVTEVVRNPARRDQQRSRLNLQKNASTSERLGQTSRPSTGGGSQGGRRRQSLETTKQDTIAGYTEFQQQSLQQLCLGAFDQNDYDEWKKAEAIFLNLKFQKTNFIGSDEDKLQLLQAMTGVSRNKEDIPKLLGSGPSYGSPHSGNIWHQMVNNGGTPSNYMRIVGTNEDQRDVGLRLG
ncbi:unnamed protein product, partial [Thlaspi arvense]